MKTLSYTELDELAGEVLPERAVLSTLLVGGNGGDSYNNNNGSGWDNGAGSSIAQNACQSHISKPDSGLLQLVGLHAQNDHQSLTCVPGTSISGH
ncbi:hypothetical protein [Actinomadura sp. SCN-SB]|uniref:hypothetical protein n=1 Tax=Actinomadura sp. SCN-SB TaxID=3373092 RepID=UPI003752008A